MAGSPKKMAGPGPAHQRVIAIVTVDGVIAAVGAQLALDLDNALQPSGAVINSGDCAVIAQDDVVTLIAVDHIAGHSAQDHVVAEVAFDRIDIAGGASAAG